MVSLVLDPVLPATLNAGGVCRVEHAANDSKVHEGRALAGVGKLGVASPVLDQQEVGTAEVPDVLLHCFLAKVLVIVDRVGVLVDLRDAADDELEES